MNRRNFLQSSAGLAAGGGALAVAGEAGESAPRGSAAAQPYPLAITMWEFSWLERRWPGAGYEDWDRALGELVERGYDAVRIDAFPHLIWNDAHEEYLLLPHWHTQDWGSPEINRVRVQPHLNRFLEACRRHRVRVGLSSWFREDADDLRMRLDTPEKLGAAWLAVLDSIAADGLLDTVFYLDLCNEWTGPAWCPFFVNDPPEAVWSGWHTEKSRDWMARAIAVLRAKYPDIPYTFSTTTEMTAEVAGRTQLDMLDLLEPHIWMSGFNGGEFYREVGYTYDRFEYTSYRNLALKGEPAYRARPDYWRNGLATMIGHAADWSRATGHPLVTTECWGVVDYKDWPLLDWGYVKELCALGTETAAGTGRWLAIETSNFCGPQFTGMWRDVAWHRRLTDAIHAAPVDPALADSPLARRMRAVG